MIFVFGNRTTPQLNSIHIDQFNRPRNQICIPQKTERSFLWTFDPITTAPWSFCLSWLTAPPDFLVCFLNPNARQLSHTVGQIIICTTTQTLWVKVSPNFYFLRKEKKCWWVMWRNPFLFCWRPIHNWLGVLLLPLMIVVTSKRIG